MTVEHILSLLKSAKPSGAGYVALCPGHQDQKHSLSVSETEDGKILMKCFAGCETKDIVQALGLELKDLFPGDDKKTGHDNWQTYNKPLTVEDLAADKMLPAPFLKDLGVENIKSGVKIAYYTYQGKPHTRQRLRFALTAKDGSSWTKAKGAPICYGGWRLKEMAERHDHLVFVEGESDAWTLWYHGLPAIGVPGADQHGKIAKGHITPFSKIYIWKEPDKGGETFVSGVCQQLARLGYQGEVYVIRSTEAKDPNELHQKTSKDGKDGLFRKSWQRIINRAEPVNLQEVTVPPADKKQKKDTGKELETDLPVIVTTDRPLRKISEEAINVLHQANNRNGTSPFIFVRSGELSKIAIAQEKDQGNNPITRPVLKPLSESALRGYLARTAEFAKIRGENNLYPCSPPLEVVKDILSLDDWPFPLLQGVVQSPILRPDGSVKVAPGYDPQTCLFYAPDKDLTMPPIPENPSVDDLITAGNLLNEVIHDFPFDSIASATNALAALLTATLRELIPGPVPMAVFDKPQQGTGASLLTDAISMIATGKPSYMTTAPEGKAKDEEWRKKVTSILMDGQPLVVIDNIEGILKSAVLGSLMTATYWSDRILGKSESTYLLHHTVWFVTGNNVRLGGDMPRRVYHIRLDARQPRPWQRDSHAFKHPDLLQWIKENRGRILAAILTIARSWIIEGKQVPNNLPRVGSYEEWTKVIGGILSHAGVPGFLENLEEMYNQAEEDDGMEAFLNACFEKWGDIPVTTKEIKKELEVDEALQEAVPDYMNHEAKEFTKHLGKALRNRLGVHFPNGLFIEKAGTFNRAVKWRIKKKSLYVQSDDVEQDSGSGGEAGPVDGGKHDDSGPRDGEGAHDRPSCGRPY